MAVLLASLIVIALLLRPHAEQDATDTRLSTHLSGPGGARALYLLMEELDLPAVRMMRPWTADAPAGVIVALAPADPPTELEIEALETWVRDGGVLIYGVGRTGDPVAARFELQLRATRRPGSRDTLRTTSRSAERAPAPPAGVTSYATRHPWSADVDSVTGFRGVFEAASPALQTDDAQVLLHTAAGDPTVVRFAAGAGQVIAWSDAAVLANRSLRTGGAALLFARTAQAATEWGGTLHFDEYHQGFRDAGPTTALWRFLTGTGTGRALLQLAVAGLALLLLAGTRLGSPLPEETARHRSPLEHVDAVAAAYRRAGARHTARRLLLAGLERRLGRRLLAGTETLTPAGGDGSAAGRRLREEWERGELVGLATAVDDFAAEVRRWR